MNFNLKKRYLLSLVLLITFISILLLSPQLKYPPYNGKLHKLEIPLEKLDSYIASKESQFSKLKPNNEARIEWADSIRKTPYSLVYLHGFSASQMEGDPIHREFAQRYGCNMYLSRLAGHGMNDQESFKDLTPKALVESAKEAIAIGQLLGDKVILMSTSTGCTLSIYLGAKNSDAIAAHIMYSPNIDLHNKLANILAWPWGLQIGRWLEGNYRSFPATDEIAQYWTTTYRLEGVVSLRRLLNKTMKIRIFKGITQPLFVGYYYKNEEESDKTVDVEAIRRFFNATSTPSDLKVLETFPHVATHVAPSGLQSKDLDDVRQKTFRFAEEVLKLERM